MFVLGLILILVSAGALAAVLASGTDDTAALYGGSVSMPTLVVFLLGAGALLLFVMGLELVRSGVKRANQNRRDRRRLRKLESREEHRDGASATVPVAGTSQATSDPSTDRLSDPPARHQDAEPASGVSGPTDGTATPGQNESRGGPSPEPPPPRSR
jgi:hypothetical protein